ncbi:Flavorubredoxin [Humidesulfovibrio mexicanus]|uniref:Flavorubredoxin n=1 Tax=Humidesulfovibrio mexicanus TaxID=147047 RepID=A0A238YBT1_9BACT|nr:FprA family A-type flavoprotein [Humidesulfovibrio mexicanus]SNR68587.1 Flavorubredoxin [Humidesulfovibrio mexicanus]
MKPVEIKKDIFWVGVVDWNSRDFHGYSLSPSGTTYNAFLVKDEKVTLFDTVKHDHLDEFLCAIAQACGGTPRIDYMVVNHLEPDHSGCLSTIVERFHPEKIFCSPMGEKNLRSYHHDSKDWPVEAVPTGSSISIGKRTVQFIETRMLHWPDNMLSYIPEDKIAFSSDAFGQNWASTERFCDEVDRSAIFASLADYYANIVLPYSAVVLKTLDALVGMNLDIDMLCPDHGLIWRGKEDVAYALDCYRQFALQKPTKKAVIVYDTMWHSTEKMASAICDGLAAEGISVRIMSVKHNHHSAVMREVLDAGAVLVGSPTHNNGILPLVADVLTYMKGLRPQNKIGAAFGSFGWSGECVKILTEHLVGMGMEMVEPAVKVKNKPDHDTFQACFELGKKVGQAINAKLSA